MSLCEAVMWQGPTVHQQYLHLLVAVVYADTVHYSWAFR